MTRSSSPDSAARAGAPETWRGWTMRVALTAVRLVPYRFRPLLARMPFAARVYTRVFLPGGRQVVTIAGGPLHNARMELDLSREKAFWSGTHEPGVQAIIADLPIDSTDDVWDIGAHIGFFSLIFARRCQRVIAVEANSTNAERLRRNVALNDASVEVVEAAVAATSGTVLLELGLDSGTHRVVSTASGHPGAPPRAAEERVPAVTLDELLLRFGRPRLVKLDIEGGEVDALAGGVQLLQAGPVIVCEIHGPHAWEVVPARLAEAGFSCRVHAAHVVAVPAW